MTDDTDADTSRLTYSATQLRFLAGQAKVVTLGLQSLVESYGVADYCGSGITRTDELDSVATSISTLLDAIAAEAGDADSAALQMVTNSALAALCVETARSVDSTQAQRFWDSLSDEQRQLLIERSPEVVINELMAAGVTFDPDELAALEAAEAHVVLTDEYWAQIGGSATLKYVTVKLSKNVSLLVQKMSDGSVLVTVIDNSTAGISPVAADDPDAPISPLSASLTALLAAASATTFRFDSEQDAKDAVEQIRNAATGVIEATRPRSLGDFFQPWKQMEQVRSSIFGDDVAAVLEKLGDRLDRITGSVAIGRSARLALASMFGTAGVSGSASIEQQLKFYRSEQIHGSDDYTAARLTLAGAISAGVSLKSLSAFGIPSTSSVEGSVSVEARALDDGTMYLVFSAAGSYATGTGNGVDNANTSSTEGKEYTIDVKIPVTQDNRERVQRAVQEIADGTGFADALDPLYDESDITVTTAATAANSGAVKAGDSKTNVNAGVGKSSSEAEVRRKRRHGDWYSQTDAQDRLDDAQHAPLQPADLP